MYIIGLQQLSENTKNIQSLRCLGEYTRVYGGEDDFGEWLTSDKDIVVSECSDLTGMMNLIKYLNENEVRSVYVQEKSLGDLPTCIAFIADERIWDESWMSMEEWVMSKKDICDIDEHGLEMLTNEYTEYIGGGENFIKKQIIKDIR